ncbi:hypothetical protein SteCoe_10099 [Stentor coeruleus]|uniref:Uncharacterized protein n=1 Tax=Stentor coeruleus TaxID=5963 RepID=A0A1R2CGF6_9CILI|nr:hypothetical protein SteCoe_10099 [Stentor coeruleus]
MAVVDTKHEGPITDSKYDYYGRRLATSSADGHVKIIESDASVSSTLSFHQGSVQCVSWSHPKYGPLLASGGSDHRVVIWKETSANKWTVAYEYIGHTGPITCLTWAPYQYGLQLLIGSIDGCVTLLKLQEHENWQSKTFYAHCNGVLACNWAPVYEGLLDLVSQVLRFATSGADYTVKIWEENSDGDLDCEIFNKHKSWVRGLAWGRELFSASDDGVVFMWRFEGSWEGLEIFNAKQIVWALDWNEMGQQVAVCCGDNVTRVIKEGQDGIWRILYEVMDNGQVVEHS